jgi:hypothetical protein
MFKRNENGFSLVELSVAAAVAVGLAVVAVTVVSGTAASVSAKGSSAASVESCTISESLAKAGGDVAANSCNVGGAMTPAQYFAANGSYQIVKASTKSGFNDTTGITVILEDSPALMPHGNQGMYWNGAGSEMRIMQSPNNNNNAILATYTNDTALKTFNNQSYDSVATQWGLAMRAAGYKADYNNGQLIMWACGDTTATASTSSYWNCPNYSNDTQGNMAAQVYTLVMWGGYGTIFNTLGYN